MTYRTLTEGLQARTPIWLHGPWGKRWTTALGGQLDLLVAWAKDGVKARFVGLCPDDALAEHGAARGLEQAPNESADDYRARLLAAWSTWLHSGTEYGIYNAFAALGWTIEPLNADGTMPTLPGATMVWLRTAGQSGTTTPTDWTRFVILLDWYAYNAGSPPAITADDIQLWKKQIWKWKAAHSTCRYIVAITSAGWYTILCGHPMCGSVTCGGSADIIPVNEP